MEQIRYLADHVLLPANSHSPRNLLRGNVWLRFSFAGALLLPASACLQVDDSPSMRAELRAARGELVEATRELREATRELVAAREGTEAPQRAGVATMQIGFVDRITGLDGVVCASELRCSAPRSLFDRILKDRSKLRRQAELSVVKRKKVVMGYRIDEVKGGSLPAVLGLRRNDVLERVQTVKLNGPKSFDAAVDALAKSDKVSLVFKRAGKRKTLVIDVST